MKPLKLVMNAFGPYGEREEIDFRKLDDKGIFLITGRTGSGKTTIFDGISYALYGETSFNERNAESLRSQFAKDDVLTEVELEFELKGKKYNVKRSPKQMGKRKRGEGLVERKPEAILEVDDENSKVVTGVKEVTGKIEELMGISGEQFRQIMMIPQGEFRKLLISDSQDREKVLRKLFDTTIYNSIQKKLGEKASEIYKHIKNQQLTRDNAIKRFEHNESQEYCKLKELTSLEDWDINSIIEVMKRIRSFEELELEKIEKESIEANRKIKEAIIKKNDAEEHNRKIKLIDSLKNEQDLLKNQEVENKNSENMLKMAQEAEKVKPHENHFLERKVEKENNANSLEKIEKRIEELSLKEKSVKAIFDKLNTTEIINDIEKKRREHTILSNNLEQVKIRQSKIEALSRVKISVKNMENAEKENKIKVANFEKKIEDEDKKRTLLEEEFKTLSDVKGEFNNVTEKQKNLERDKAKLTELCEKVMKLYKEGKEFGSEINSVKAKIKENEDTKRNLLERLLKAQASIIAATLVSGEACPVCGSKEHPVIKTLKEEPISMEDIDHIDKWLNQYKESLRNLESDRAAIQGKYESGVENFKHMKREMSQMYDIEIEDGDKYPKILTMLEEKLKEYNRSVIEIERKLSRRLAIEKEIRAISDSLRETRENLLKSKGEFENLEKEMKENREREIELESSLKEIEKNIPKEYLELSSLQKRIEEIENGILKWEKENKEAQEAMKSIEKEMSSNFGSKENISLSLKNSEVALKEAYEKFMNMIQKDFKDIQAYQVAKKESYEIESMKNRLDAYKKKKDENEVKLKDIMSRVKSMETIEIIDINNEIEILEEKMKAIDGNKGAMKSRSSNNENVVIEIESITKNIQGHEKEYKVVGHMAKVAKGENAYRMTFERYVLAAFLEDILNAANLRFQKMTGNRYLLSRTDELERKNKQSGLELQVYDNYTGLNRHVKTLSGGESFKASLSMALGLSDVVQSYAGGVRMDTMFIDEGFGTLDPESLDSAIECLIDLQKVGRLVGIISHVPELKERMEAQLVVHASNGGSRTEILVR